MHTRHKIGRWATSFTALALAVGLSGCKSPETGTATGGNSATGTGTGTSTGISKAKPYTGEDILLGEFSSLTGGTATFGQSTHNGILMALDEINAKGGVLNKKVRVQVEDDGSKTDQVAPAIQKLINQANVLAIIGEVASSNSLAAAPLCQEAGVPMLSPASTNPEVTKKGDYIFRTCFIDTFVGTAMAKFALTDLKAKTAAVLTDSSSDYSKGLTEFFVKGFEDNGGKIVATADYTQGDTEFRAPLTKIKAAKPDVIFVPGYYTEVANIAVQARSQGINQPMLGSDGWDSPELFKIGKAAVQGSYISNHYSPDSKDPRVVKFVADYKKRNEGQTPDALAAVAYDAAYIMVDAIRRAGDTDREKIRDALAATKNFAGVTGTITMDENRDAQKPLTILQIQGDGYKFVTTVKP
jgi:branched-chain amino acid transport system substrate-binding protein